MWHGCYRHYSVSFRGKGMTVQFHPLFNAIPLDGICFILLWLFAVWQLANLGPIGFFFFYFLSGKDMFINIRHNCAQKMFFVNSWITSVYLNFRHWNLLYTRNPFALKVRRKGLPFPNFHSGKSYLVKITVFLHFSNLC